MGKINIYLIGLIFLAMTLGSVMPIFAATVYTVIFEDGQVVRILESEGGN
jgi:hypothetical protein